MKLIDKEILLLKIDSKIEEAQKVFNVAPSSVIGGMIEGYTRIKKIVSSIEVEEVDLDFQSFAKEMDAIFALPSSETKNTTEEPLNWEYAIAKHFFELGMQVSNKAQKGE